MLALDISPSNVLGALVAAVLLGTAVGLVLFLNLPHAAWATLGDELAARTTISIDPAYRPLVAGAVVLGAVGALFGLIVGAWRGRSFSAAFGGLVGGVIAGAALGAFTAITFSAEVAVALGVTIALATWPVLVAQPVLDGSYDWEALKARYWPGLTVETARETYEQLKQRAPEMPTRPGTPHRPGMPGRRGGR